MAKKAIWIPPGEYRPTNVRSKVLVFMALFYDWYAPDQIARLLGAATGSVTRYMMALAADGLLQYRLGISGNGPHPEWLRSSLTLYKPVTDVRATKRGKRSLCYIYRRRAELQGLHQSGELFGMVNPPDVLKSAPLYLRVLRFLRDHLTGYSLRKLWKAVPNQMRFESFRAMLRRRPEFSVTFGSSNPEVRMSGTGFLKDERQRKTVEARKAVKAKRTAEKRKKTLRRKKREQRRRTKAMKRPSRKGALEL